jgi:hypothetical protein
LGGRQSEKDHFDLNIMSNEEKCGFCDQVATKLDPFISSSPFVSKVMKFWCHESCAKFSPEVVKKDDQWFNVSKALKRGKNLKCVKCEKIGATLGCFNTKCFRNYHLHCTDKPQKHFEDKIIFWCPRHEAIVNRMDDYDDLFSCDVCNAELKDSWHTCSKCEMGYYNTFDLCSTCFDNSFPDDHVHKELDFIATSLEDRKQHALTEKERFAKKRKDGVDHFEYLGSKVLLAKKLKKMKKLQQIDSCAFCRYNITTESKNCNLYLIRV